MEAIPGLVVLIIFIIITYYKRKSQIGSTWEVPEGTRVTINDKHLTCSHCGYDKFSKCEGLLNTSYVLLFHFGFWNRSCACYVCRWCGYLHWFVSPKETANFERND